MLSLLAQPQVNKLTKQLGLQGEKSLRKRTENYPKMSKSSRESLKRKHWSIKAHESLISRNADGHFCLNIEGGAELGLFPFVGEIRQDRIRYQSGRLHHGEIVMEVNHKRVPGMIKKDVIALIKRSADPVSLVTVKQSE